MADELENDLTDQMNNVCLEDDIGDEGIDLDNPVTAEDLPSILIVTSVADGVFENEETKQYFERLFKEFDPDATFQYLKSFRRARVNFNSQMAALRARIQLDEMLIEGKKIKCFFAQPLNTGTNPQSRHLHPPKPEKQFLISPPASPPVGWEPVHEAQPIINYDIISAIANLAPGESHEIHPPSDNHPAIVVHVCEEPNGLRRTVERPKNKIEQTKRPEMK
ncbi:calcipressin-1-like isoform X2 [Lineus longissimus]|uniref:calcipressin-1-like isoform X2 n=1 Tax=Lineus longissimus TaxID=88925 RepID=UPI00315DD1D1